MDYEERKRMVEKEELNLRRKFSLTEPEMTVFMLAGILEKGHLASHIQGDSGCFCWPNAEIFDDPEFRAKAPGCPTGGAINTSFSLLASALAAGKVKAKFYSRDYPNETKDVPTWVWCDEGRILRAFKDSRWSMDYTLGWEWSKWDCQRWAMDDKSLVEYCATGLEKGLERLTRLGVQMCDPAIAAGKHLSTQLPSEKSWIRLSEALSWIAFGFAMDSSTVSELMSSDYRDLPKEVTRAKIQAAMDMVADLGTTSDIEFRGQFQINYIPLENSSSRRVVDSPRTVSIPPLELHQFRQFLCGDILVDPNAPPIQDGRALSPEYAEVLVRRENILAHFPPKRTSIENAVSTVKAENECAKWLEEQFARLDPQSKPKAKFKEEATVTFIGLSSNGFTRAWDRATSNHPERRSPGRKKTRQ